MSEQPWLKRYPDGVDWQAPVPERPLHALLDDAVTRFATNPALDFLGRTYTWEELGGLTDRAASGLQRLGAAKGTRVGLLLPNCPQFLIAYFGALKAGATVVAFNPQLDEAALRRQIEDSGSEIMVTLDSVALYPKLRAAARGGPVRRLVVGRLADALPFPKGLFYPLFSRSELASVERGADHLGFRQLLANDGVFESPDIDPAEDLAVLQYTGGTTGDPKGVMLTHANLYANAVQNGLWFKGLTPGGERVLGMLPLFHSFAMTSVMNLAVHLGAEIVLHPRFDAEHALRDIARKAITLLPCIPTMSAAMAEHPRFGDADLSSLKLCICGGAPLAVEVRQRLEQRFGCRSVECYGLAEASPVAICNPAAGPSKPGSIGLPLPGTSIVIADRQGTGRELPHGEAGEICIRGPQVMKGYWQRPEASAAALRDGLLHTGDIGYIDEDGYVFLIDRVQDLIQVGDFAVYPRHVETAIRQHPAIAEATVIGIAHPRSGQVPKAFVTRQQGADPVSEEELLDFLRERLGRHEIPGEVEFRDALPRNVFGQLSKTELAIEERRRFHADGDPLDLPPAPEPAPERSEAATSA